MDGERCKFWAHSVLDESGSLVDITPIDPNTARDSLFFLLHEGVAAEFERLKIRWPDVLYPRLTFEEWQQSQAAANTEVCNDEEAGDVGISCARSLAIEFVRRGSGLVVRAHHHESLSDAFHRQYHPNVRERRDISLMIPAQLHKFSSYTHEH